METADESKRSVALKGFFDETRRASKSICADRDNPEVTGMSCARLIESSTALVNFMALLLSPLTFSVSVSRTKPAAGGLGTKAEQTLTPVTTLARP